MGNMHKKLPVANNHGESKSPVNPNLNHYVNGPNLTKKSYLIIYINHAIVSKSIPARTNSLKFVRFRAESSALPAQHLYIRNRISVGFQVDNTLHTHFPFEVIIVASSRRGKPSLIVSQRAALCLWSLIVTINRPLGLR